ncbi:phospholipase D-like domain-containing protein [Desulfosarcina sp.]|nr:phospholipase D-like domain-containing protein [Desulfosarcina sp.]
MITKSSYKKTTADGRFEYSQILIALVLLLISGCSADNGDEQANEAGERTISCSQGVKSDADCPSPGDAIKDESISLLHERRSWKDYSNLPVDPIQLATQAKKPILPARTKIIGLSQDDTHRSLAAKLWMIENAQHTVDVVYYIFQRDRVGYAILGALCNAVKRGVDIRIIVDSLGSIHPTHSELKALDGCADDAGFMRNDNGLLTTSRARVQVAIFNALSRPTSLIKLNRRSHDKLLLVDGHFPDKAILMTGGRNISLAYYGFHDDGSADPTAYRDLEILLRPAAGDTLESVTVGNVSSNYYRLLFRNQGNKLISSGSNQRTEDKQQELAQQSLLFIKNLPYIQEKMSDISAYMNSGFHESKVRLIHELDNLSNAEVVTAVDENKSRNPNSLKHIFAKVIDIESSSESGDTVRFVSPYLFVAEYYDKDDKLVFDGAKEINEWLAKHPNGRLEIITNSVMTSDNFFAQSIIDMDLGPRLLLSPELREAWLAESGEGESSSELVTSEAWKKQINHPRVFIYETGKLDSVMLGKDTHYGKLHAKFITGGDLGYVGTSNFDYRSRLYNNEMGFFIDDDALNQDLVDEFEWLKSQSYRWGSAEWLQMRNEVMKVSGLKGWSVRNQRLNYKLMKATGTDWLF